MNLQLHQYIKNLGQHVHELPPDRREPLDRLVAWINTHRDQWKVWHLIYICTHNSRRSHFGEFWAEACGRYFGLKGFSTGSGGTEITAMNPRTVAALQRAGFYIKMVRPGHNPMYEVKLGQDSKYGGIGFSKLYYDLHNVQTGFAAIMMCASADAACPVIEEAALRLSTPFDDPKQADDTPQEQEVYDRTSWLIALEQYYVMEKVAKG